MNRDPLGPRYAGVPVTRADAASAVIGGRALRVVTYNVRWGRHVTRAIHVLKHRPPLPEADIIVLQEMDAAGTRRIAEAIGMGWALGRHSSRRAFNGPRNTTGSRRLSSTGDPVWALAFFPN